MEFILSFGKQALLVPVWALIHAPFLCWSAKLTKVARVSILAAFTLGLITGAASLIASLLLYPLYLLIADPFVYGISWLVGFVVTIWLYGYFLRGESGNPIGLWRGIKVFTVEMALMLAFLLAVVLLYVLVGRVLT